MRGLEGTHYGQRPFCSYELGQIDTIAPKHELTVVTLFGASVFEAPKFALPVCDRAVLRWGEQVSGKQVRHEQGSAEKLAWFQHHTKASLPIYIVDVAGIPMRVLFTMRDLEAVAQLKPNEACVFPSSNVDRDVAPAPKV